MDAHETDAYGDSSPDAHAQDRIDLMASLLSMNGRSLQRIVSSPFQLRLDVDDDEGHTVIIEGRTTIHAEGLADWHGLPEGDAGMAHAARIAAAEMLGAYVNDAGDLRLDFTDEQYLVTYAEPDFEAWEIHTDEGLLAVCAPGGGLQLYSEGSPRES